MPDGGALKGLGSIAIKAQFQAKNAPMAKVTYLSEGNEKRMVLRPLATLF
jgi:hypothetical protein